MLAVWCLYLECGGKTKERWWGKGSDSWCPSWLSHPTCWINFHQSKWRKVTWYQRTGEKLPGNSPDEALKHMLPTGLTDSPRQRSIARQVGEHSRSVVRHLKQDVWDQNWCEGINGRDTRVRGWCAVNNMKSWDSSPLSTIYLYPIFARVKEKAELSNKRPRHQTPSALLHLSQQLRSWARQNNQWLTSAILPRRPIMFLSSSIVSGKASLHCRNTLAENFVNCCGGERAHFV